MAVFVAVMAAAASAASAVSVSSVSRNSPVEPFLTVSAKHNPLFANPEAARPARSMRSATCDRIRPDAPLELLEACRKGDFGAEQQNRSVSLDGVAACLEVCDPEHTCGRFLKTCITPDAVSALRCEVTHTTLITREGSDVFGPHDAPYRIFVVATPGCLRRNEDGRFRDDAGALRLMMSFPEKLVIGDAALVSVVFPPSWGLTLTGKGVASFLIPPEYRMPPDSTSHIDPFVSAVSVFRSSRARQENGFRATTFSALANRLHIASTREPARKDSIPVEGLFAIQLVEITFTVMCRSGGAGVGAVIIKTLARGAKQAGRSIGADDGGDGLRRRPEMTAADMLKDKSPSARWIIGGGAPSPVSGRTVSDLKIAWMCITLDTWTGEITDFREVLIGDGRTSVSRTRNTGVFVDLSSELPVNVTGLGGVALGIGKAEEDILGSSDGRKFPLGGA